MESENDKQSWRRTRVSWETKKRIWERWALGDTEADTIEYFTLYAEEYPKAPSHRHTINKVRKELLELPLPLLRKLADELPEIKDFVKERRPDYAEQKAQESEQQSQHSKELTTAVLIMASNLEKYRNEPAAYLGTETDTVSEWVYGGWWVGDNRAKLGDVNRKAAAELLKRLKEEGEFPELANIEDWSELNDTQITENFIQRLIARAHRGNF